MQQLGAASLRSRMLMNQMLTQDWWPEPKTCSLGCQLNQPLTQPWFRECHAHSSDMHQRLTQMKSETASFPHASATDSINIQDCKFLAPATNLASASDSSCKFSILLHQRLIHHIRVCKSLPIPIPWGTQLLQIVLKHPIY